MESDLSKVVCKNKVETDKYIYGSAEVIGLFMAKIIGLKKESYVYARLLGKAMQYINFIRDIKEDAELCRSYLPLDKAKKLGLESLDLKSINDINNKKSFESYINDQLKKFYYYDVEARKGFKFIPKKYLIPIITAQDMYLWTAKKIQKYPLIVLSKKVKPGKFRILSKLIYNYFKSFF